MIKRNLMRGAVLLLEAMAAMREAVPAHCHQYPSLRGQLAEAVQLAIRSPTPTNHSSEGRARRDGGISIKARCASADCGGLEFEFNWKHKERICKKCGAIYP